MKIITPAQMKALDQRAIEELGLPGAVLMETAGRGVVAAICERLGRDGNGRVATVLCGVGNNGGDGFVIARELHYRGFRVHVYTVGDRGKMSDDARLHYKVMQGVGVRDRHYTKPPDKRDLGTLRRSLSRAAVIVDALSGVGPTAELREPLKTFVAQVDGRHSGLVVAVDVPSGIHALTGAVLGVATCCDLTCSMAALKTGLTCGEGPQRAGELRVIDIGIPPAWLDQQEGAGEVMSAANELSKLPERDAFAHKGSHGHLFLVAGSAGRAGAALLAGQAALRSGVGLCTLATSGEVRSRLEGSIPDLMVEALRGGASERKKVEKLLAGKSAIAIGPGLGTSSAQIDLVRQLLEMSACPIALDADALNCLALKPDISQPAAGRLVLTPHPGEMARLLETDIATIESDRIGHARAAAKRFAAVVVLKGARTVIATPDQRFAICDVPNAALAKAGSGDVLCGVIGALLAQGVALDAAARVGVMAHSVAGGLVAHNVGAISATASDIVAELPQAWRR